MREKDERYFYYRFVALKPEDMTESDWFQHFGWNVDDIRNKRSDWKKIERPHPDTIIHIASKYAFTPEQILYLQYGNLIPLSSGERGEGKKANG